jgi:site-specific recombinase XerD
LSGACGAPGTGRAGIARAVCTSPRTCSAAWQLFVAAKAWGPFNTGSFAKRLRSAGWPEGVRPYQLRHTVGLALSEAGVDLADVSALLGHSRPLTTRSHYVPVLGSRLQDAHPGRGSDRLAYRAGGSAEHRG